MTASKPAPRDACFYAGETCAVGDTMGSLLAQVMASMRREVETRMAAFGVTEAQWKPLWMLQAGRAETAFELAREMGIDAGAVTRMLDRLEAKGLVTRERSEADRRVVHLRLTDEGAAAAARVPHVLAEVNNDFLRGFSEADFAALRSALERMRANGRALRQPDEETSA